MNVWDILLIIVSSLLILIIILQETDEDAASAFTGEKSDLFANKKEVWIKRVTAGLSIAFFVLCIVCAFFAHRG